MAKRLESLASLPSWVQDWIELEQTANDRVSHPRLKHRFELDERQLASEYWPEHRSVFRLQYVLLPARQVVEFGPAAEFLEAHFAIRSTAGNRLIFVHPGNGYIKRKLSRLGIALHDSPVLATPTSSFRSLLCWHPDWPDKAAVVKVALHARISGVRRFLGEIEVAGSIYTSVLLREIPETNKQQVALDFFHDEAGSYCRRLNLGQIFRLLPSMVSGESRLVPGFSFGSKQHDRLLLTQLTPSKSAAQALMKELIERYVTAISYLQCREGIAHECHSQNVLFEVRGAQVMRVILRDYHRAAVWPALRRRLGRPVPAWPGLRRSRFAARRLLYYWLAPRAPTAYLRVFGVRGVVWECARALRLAGCRDQYLELREHYLRCWQEASAVWLGVWPRRVPKGPSLALNDAIQQFIETKP